MPTAIVTPDLDAIVSEIDIAAPPERVFRALTCRPANAMVEQRRLQGLRF
jgi:hypothetical protein